MRAASVHALYHIDFIVMFTTHLQASCLRRAPARTGRCGVGAGAAVTEASCRPVLPLTPGGCAAMDAA